MSAEWVLENMELVWKTLDRLDKAPVPLPEKHVEHYQGLVSDIRPYWDVKENRHGAEEGPGEAAQDYDPTWPTEPCAKCGGDGFHPPCRLPYPGAGSYANVYLAK